MKTAGWCVCLLVLLVLTVTATADWVAGDPAKFVQLPNSQGIDVYNISNVDGVGKVLADDFLCTSMGPISDVHFWGSWRGDHVGQITSIQMAIFSDLRAPGANFSQPGDLLFSRNFDPAQFIVSQVGQGPQTWFNPNTGELLSNDHTGIWQVNIPLISDPFIQTGTAAAPKIFWLGLLVQVADPQGTQWGWKTTFQHFEDDATFADLTATAGLTSWQELTLGTQSLELSFVITPEPVSLVLLGLGSLVLINRRKK
jgi:hypothetical protein